MFTTNSQKIELRAGVGMIRAHGESLNKSIVWLLLASTCCLLLFNIGQAWAQDALPGALNGRIINCETPHLGKRANRTNTNCYQTELTQAERDLRNLHRALYDKASFAERRKLRELETIWRNLRDTQCILVSGLESDVTNSLTIDKFCRAVLTRARVEEVRQLNYPLLERSSAPDAPEPSTPTQPDPGLIRVQ